jgi:HK97 gp10 family phage protein
MAAKSRIILRSNFPEAKRAMAGAVGAARDKALDVGEDEAETKLERLNDSRGYNLPTDIEQETQGEQSGRIIYPFFFGRFFEYGTVYIPASSFMRPAHRKMKKAFVDELGDQAPKWIRRKAGM